MEWGCTPHQRTLVATLETLPRLAMAACFQPPSTIVVGEVVALREMGVAWFSRRGTLACMSWGIFSRV
ncbi:MAG UNVERIFIED_CONTAM: hypothetical protein LVT10_03905 [Anaerolineae bacterium]